MTKSSHQASDHSTDGKSNESNRKPAKSKIGGIAVAALIALYSIAAPKINEAMGWNLPTVPINGSTQVAERSADADKLGPTPSNPTPSNPTPSNPTPSNPTPNNTAPASSQRAEAGPSQATASPTKPSQAKRLPVETDTLTPKSVRSKPVTASSQPPTDSSESGDRVHGLLREVSKDRYLSPEGLLYTPGSAEGHRLKHLERHTRDQPNRPGSHGVFDGELEGALKTIDRAYQRAKKNQRTTKKTDRGRTIYTVDMGGRVGFVGGRDGNRRRKPMARRVRLVLDGNRVITAYPL